MPKQTQKHQPVLLSESLQYLAPQSQESYLDLTAGYGGHATAILALTQRPEAAVLVDRDKTAINHLEQLEALRGVQLINSDFYRASQVLIEQRRSFDLILADLGVSSPHLNTASRGFSIAHDGPLDMRMDQNQTLTAATLLNESSAEDLEDILRRYGEEPHAMRIAQAIVAARPLLSTTQLAHIISSLPRLRSKGKRVHPATKAFQALRIAVNDELGLLEKALPLWIQLLAPGGRIAVISFHSLEDRLVKQALTEQAGKRYDATLELLVKSPVQPTNTEIVHNPRARSAKLRAAVKINTKEEE